MYDCTICIITMDLSISLSKISRFIPVHKYMYADISKKKINRQPSKVYLNHHHETEKDDIRPSKITTNSRSIIL